MIGKTDGFDLCCRCFPAKRVPLMLGARFAFSAEGRRTRANEGAEARLVSSDHWSMALFPSVVADGGDRSSVTPRRWVVGASIVISRLPDRVPPGGRSCLPNDSGAFC